MRADRRTPRALAFIGAAFALACAGCLIAGPAPARSQSLLALGDSYSSGEGVPPYDNGTDVRTNRCHRSQGAWPILAAIDLRLPRISWACSGADTRDIDDQLLHVIATPSIVTLTIGGNDVHFRRVLTTCVLWVQPCDRHYTRRGVDWIERDIADLERRLPRVYASIRFAAPGARLMVVGYPRIFPRKVPTRGTAANCAAWDSIDPDEADYLNDKTDSLNRAIRRAASRASVQFVGVSRAFSGEELRCVGESSVHRLELLRQGRFVSRASFHPNARGHRRLADLVATRLHD
jgi:lysophospholipase L1-like esterase